MSRVRKLPRDAGAYALLIRLGAGFRGDVGALGPVSLPSGVYAYLGSANGPGGIAARVGRHLQANKKPHWHIDRLTVAGKITRVAAWPGGNECALVAAMELAGGTSIPVAGFGASDCRTCRAHLLRVSKIDVFETALSGLPGLSLYSAASLAPRAATDPSIV